MPPLDWSIIQHALLFLILPSFGVAAGGLAISNLITRTESGRSTAASFSFIAGFAAGNLLSKLVPFGEIETGWRSLFWATAVATAIEIRINITHHRGPGSRFEMIATVVLAMVSAMLLTPWGISFHPWIFAVMYLAILENWKILRLVSERQNGHYVPLIVAIGWGGSATAVLVLSHSARFAELAVLFSCALAGIGLVSAIARQRLNGIYAGPAVFIPGLMLAAALNTYSDIPNASFALVAVSPGLLEFLHWKVVAAWFDRHPKTLVFVSLIPCAIAVALAMQAEL